MEKILKVVVPGLILVPLAFLIVAAVGNQMTGGHGVPGWLTILSGFAGASGVLLLFVVCPLMVILYCCLPSGPKSAVMTHGAMDAAARAVLCRHWHSSRRHALRLCTCLLVLQLIVQAVYYIGWGRHESFARLVVATLIGMLAPFGWLVLIVAGFARSAARRFRKDLAAGEIRTLQGIIEKGEPFTSDSDELFEQQSIRFRGETDFLQVPRVVWERLPARAEGVCEYFPNTRIVYRINGVDVWDADGKGSDAFRA